MAAARGDFEALYREHGPGLYKLALGLTGNGDEAEDAVQETFCRAFAAYGSFRGDAAFSTWAYRICVNLLRDRLRRRRRLPVEIYAEDRGIPLEEMVEAHPADDPLCRALAEDVRLKCLHCFSECLPRRPRQVFCLSFVLGFGQARIAEILETSPGAVKAALHRARRRLDGYLNGRCGFMDPRNPCDCRQWVRFCAERGIVRPPRDAEDLEAKAERVRLEMARIFDLRSLYASIYEAKSEDYFARRLKEGIGAKEWFSL